MAHWVTTSNGNSVLGTNRRRLREESIRDIAFNLLDFFDGLLLSEIV